LLGEDFRVFKDLSIEVPFNFSDEEFDRFLVEVGRRGIFAYRSVEDSEPQDRPSFRTI